MPTISFVQMNNSFDELMDLLSTSSTMKRVMTVSQLNMSCTVAAAKARRNSFRLPICVNDTNVLVTEVPTLAPMIIGIAAGTSKTAEIIFIEILEAAA